HHLRFVLPSIVGDTESRTQCGGNRGYRTHDKWLFLIFGYLKIGIAFQPNHTVCTIETICDMQLAGTVEEYGTAIRQGKTLAFAGSGVGNHCWLRLLQGKRDGAVYRIFMAEKHVGATDNEQRGRNGQPTLCTA